MLVLMVLKPTIVRDITTLPDPIVVVFPETIVTRFTYSEGLARDTGIHKLTVSTVVGSKHEITWM